MAATKGTPTLLEAYLKIPHEGNLTLLTSVLGATSNWLIQRILSEELRRRDPTSSAPPSSASGVVLVSFLRDAAFWCDSAQRLGLDLACATRARRFVCVNLLDGLYLGRPRDSLACSEPRLSSVVTAIRAALDVVQAERVVLVIDSLDVLLAAEESLTAMALGETLLELRENVYATVVSLSADSPLVHSCQAPLEREHAAFLLSVAHQADLVMSLRMLDTGTARDVTGVININVRDNFGYADEHGIENKELLYFVGGDGSVKVFERGE